MLSKSQAKLFFLAGTVIFSVLFLGLSFDTHVNRVGDQTHEENITEAVIAGKHLWEENNCMGCHTIMGEGAYYAPELTKVVERRGAPYIKGVLMSKTPWGEHTSGRKMVAYGMTEEEADNLVEYLTWIGNVDLNGFPAKPKYKIEKNN
ncbi:MAG: c-type cytochrome [Vicingaceae bacterium]